MPSRKTRAIGRKLHCRASCYLMSYPSFNEEVSRTTNLGHPAYPRPKGTGDQSMPEKRRQARSASRTLRETRVTRSRFDYLKSNPDRDISCPLTRERNP